MVTMTWCFCINDLRASSDLLLYMSLIFYTRYPKKVQLCPIANGGLSSPLVLLCLMSPHVAGQKDEKTWYLFEIRENVEWVKML